MKFITATAFLFIYYFSVAQNVGIGATMPNMKLHISSPSDTALLQVDNNAALANNTNTGMYFKNGSYFTGAIKAIGTGTNVARMGLYTFAAPGQNSLLERMSILDNGNVGINNNNPLNKLDVNGTFRATGNAVIGGTLQVQGGTPGTGKVLTSDASGNASWQTPDVSGCMTNSFHIFDISNYTNFIVPAGVTKVFVKMWGSGGNGSSTLSSTLPYGGGGGGGAYSAFFLNVTPGSTITGKIQSTTNSITFYTVFKYNGDSLRCIDGENGTNVPGRGGNVSFAGIGWTLTTAMENVYGQDGTPNTFDNYTIGATSYSEYIGGNGGGSAGIYGQRGQVTLKTGVTETTKAELSSFLGAGAGGGAVTRTGGTTIGDNSGGTGKIIIYY